MKLRAKRRVSAATAACLMILAAAFCVPPSPGITLTNTIEFAASLPPRGSVEWKVNQESSARLQDSYRKRVAIPYATSPFVPRAASADLINGRSGPPIHPMPSDVVGKVFDFIFFTGILALIGALFARKVAPHLLIELNQRWNPWAMPLAGVRTFPTYLREEEKPFGEFVAAFRAGPGARSGEGSPATEDPHYAFYVGAKKRLAMQRKLLQDIIRETNDVARKKLLVALYFDLGLLKDEARFPEALPAWQLASAMEGLLKELSGKIRNTTPSNLRTILRGLDLLDDLCAPGLQPGLLTDQPLKFLVVDDDLISRQALSLSLKKAFSQPDLAMDGPSALAQVTRQTYDVIFLDVQMPGMDGFELCEKIHNCELNRVTPVVFVTSQSDFDARAKSTLIGGNDLMGKPFLIFEVTVKALTLALQGRLQNFEFKRELQTGTAAPAPGPEAHAPVCPMFTVNPAGNRKSLPATAYAGMNDTTRAFVNRAIKHLGPLRELCRLLPETEEPAARQNLLADAFLRLNSLCQNAAEITHPAHELSNALEALLRKLLQDAKHSTPSAVATISTAVDLLDDLCAPGLDAELAVNPPIRLLVVDDDLTTRRALTGALQTVFEKPANAESGESALELARVEPFDVIFMDIQMPGMNGFETCSKIRETDANRETPVVFVTVNDDFAARAETSRIGGNDLVGKPFLTAEINVKALTYAMRGRIKQSQLEPV